MTDDSHPADDLVSTADYEQKAVTQFQRQAAQWFHDREEELFPRHEATRMLADDLAISENLANRIITDLVSDIVDPVVLVDDGETVWVGVIRYDEHDVCYEYDEYNPTFGRVPKAVCAQCVQEAEFDADVAYAMAGHGTLSSTSRVEEVRETVQEHFEEAHGDVDVEIKTGATLTSSPVTTIGGNEVIHKGNMSSEADGATLGGKTPGDLAPTYSDGTTNCHIVSLERFGAEGSSTTNTAYTTIANSDLTFNPDEYKDDSGTLYIRMKAHLKHQGAGTTYCRMYRQNAATVVSGTEVTKSGDGWGVSDTGWVQLTDTGYDSYQLQLRTNDGASGDYNSVLLFFGIPA